MLDARCYQSHPSHYTSFIDLIFASMRSRACDCASGTGVGLSRTVEYIEVAWRNSHNDISSSTILCLLCLLAWSKGILPSLLCVSMLAPERCPWEHKFRTKQQGSEVECNCHHLGSLPQIPIPTRHGEHQFYALGHYRKTCRLYGAVLIPLVPARPCAFFQQEKDHLWTTFIALQV